MNRETLNGTYKFITRYDISSSGSTKSWKYITYINGVAYTATKEEINTHNQKQWDDDGLFDLDDIG
jgi:hypothetical protein